MVIHVNGRRGLLPDKRHSKSRHDRDFTGRAKVETLQKYKLCYIRSDWLMLTTSMLHMH